MFDHETYLSPFTWRYGSREMQEIWSEAHRRRLWRRVWVALAEAQETLGFVSREQAEDLKAHQEEIDIRRALEIEAEIHHDVMAEIKTYAEQCPVGGSVIHFGATSADITDNADVLRIREAIDLTLYRIHLIIEELAEMAERWADVPCVAFTHLQRAEITTVGYRISQHLQDLWEDCQALIELRSRLRGKGFKGAVGTYASYAQALGSVEAALEMERIALEKLGLEAFPTSTQVYPRRQDWEVITTLSGLAGSLYRLAFNIRLLQSPLASEWSEPFHEKQVGSSAMPFKRNPVRMEKVNSLARLVHGFEEIAWENAAHSLLERTLDDSANRREFLPTAFLAIDEILVTMAKVLGSLRIDEETIKRNVAAHAPFAATEAVLMEAVKNGGDRQELHEALRELSMKAWESTLSGKENPLPRMISEDQRFTSLIPQKELQKLFDASNYVGAAPIIAREIARQARNSTECPKGSRNYEEQHPESR